MSPRTKEEWTAVLTWIEWFLWLVREHEPRQISKAINAAMESLCES